MWFKSCVGKRKDDEESSNYVVETTPLVTSEDVTTTSNEMTTTTATDSSKPMSRVMRCRNCISNCLFWTIFLGLCYVTYVLAVHSVIRFHSQGDDDEPLLGVS